MAHPLLTTVYGEVVADPSGADLCANWENPFTGAPSPIEGIRRFEKGATGWGEDFLKNLYLIDYYWSLIVMSDELIDRSATGTPIWVGADPRARTDFLWDIVKPSGDIDLSVSGWSQQFLGSGDISSSGYESYSLLDTSGDLPLIIRYAWTAPAYLDNYDGNLVLFAGQGVGGTTVDDQAGHAVDLSADSSIDGLAAPTESGGYYGRLSGFEAYYDTPASGDPFYSSGEAALPDLEAPMLWADDGEQGGFDGTDFDPDSPEFQTEEVDSTIELTTERTASPSGTNIFSRDIAQKVVVYLARKMNQLNRLTYGNIQGYQTNIPDATGQVFDMTIENGTDITPSGSAFSFPVVEDPYTGSGEVERRPDNDAQLYPSGTPDWTLRALAREIDDEIDNSIRYGSMTWAAACLQYIRRRTQHMGGIREYDDAGTALVGGRLWRAMMPLASGEYASTGDLPRANEDEFLAEDEADGVYSVDGTYYFRWNDTWMPAWTDDPALAAEWFPVSPSGYGELEGWGITGLPSIHEDWTQYDYRTYYEGPPASGEWHVAPGLGVYWDLKENAFEDDLYTSILDRQLYALAPEELSNFDIADPAMQFVSLFKTLHARIGSLKHAYIADGHTLNEVLADDFDNEFTFDASGEYITNVMTALWPAMKWHMITTGTPYPGEVDAEESMAANPSITFENVMNNEGYINLVDPTPSGDYQFIWPHKIGYHPDYPELGPYDWRDGIRLTYFEG